MAAIGSDNGSTLLGCVRQNDAMNAQIQTMRSGARRWMPTCQVRWSRGTVDVAVKQSAAYDEQDRLLTETFTLAPAAANPMPAPSYRHRYEYDANGAQSLKATEAYTAGAFVADAEPQQFRFDTRGRLAQVSQHKLKFGSTTETQLSTIDYAYDHHNFRVGLREDDGQQGFIRPYRLEAWLADHHNPTGYAQARERELSADERLAFHQAHSGPVLAELKAWLAQQIDEKRVEPNSALGAAIAYLRNHWEELTLFLRVAGAPLDNNTVERALKKAILHRKNSLLYKTQHGARVGDLYMSLIYTCELCGASPFDYLTQLQRHAAAVALAPEHWLPWNYRAAVPAAVP